MFDKSDARRKLIVTLALSSDNRKIVVRYFINRARVGFLHQLTIWHCPHFAVACRCCCQPAGCAAISQDLLATRLTAAACGGKMRDRQIPGSYTDHALHTMWAVPIITLGLNGSISAFFKTATISLVWVGDGILPAKILQHQSPL